MRLRNLRPLRLCAVFPLGIASEVEPDELGLRDGLPHAEFARGDGLRHLPFRRRAAARRDEHHLPSLRLHPGALLEHCHGRPRRRAA